MVPVPANTRPSSPYAVGNELALTLTSGHIAKAKIVELKTMTMSCVMVVQLKSSPDLLILKVYDRRYADDFREHYRVAEWNWDIEKRFQDLDNKDASLARWTAVFLDDNYDDESGDNESLTTGTKQRTRRILNFDLNWITRTRSMRTTS